MSTGVSDEGISGSSSSSSSYGSIKAKGAARNAEQKRTEERKRAALVLVHHYLISEGHSEAAQRLQDDIPSVDLSAHEVADNVDMTIILQDYEEYFTMRFDRRPVLFRKAAKADPKKKATKSKGERNGHRAVASSATASPVSMSPRNRKAASATDQVVHLPRVPGSSPAPPTSATAVDAAPKQQSRQTKQQVASPQQAPSEVDFGLTVKPIAQQQVPPSMRRLTQQRPASGPPAANSDEESGSGSDDEGAEEKKYAIPEGLFPSAELRELAETINRDVVLTDPKVRWEDIVGLESAKRLVKEAVVMPIKYPQLFQGILSPWKGVLLFGPPGTGKTLIAKAVATEVKTTFFNISASSIASKWRGDSEKLIRVLFDLARARAPSTIFLDEIDALMGNRGDDSFEHEASRRTKTEMLIQMDGLVKSDNLVFVLAASNLPWTLDAAFLRRLEKRIYVPLPDVESRAQMFKILLPPNVAPDIPYQELAQRTENYSGSDLRVACKESAMCPLRRLLATLETTTPPQEQSQEQETPPKVGPVTIEDVVTSLDRTHPTTTGRDCSRYEKWMSDFGST